MNFFGAPPPPTLPTHKDAPPPPKRRAHECVCGIYSRKAARPQSIPVGGVSTGHLTDCEVQEFQNSKVKHPFSKRRLGYFTGVSVRGRHTVDHVRRRAPHNNIKLGLLVA